MTEIDSVSIATSSIGPEEEESFLKELVAPINYPCMETSILDGI